MFDAGGVLHVSNTAVGDDIQKELGLSNEQSEKLFEHYIPLLGTGKITEQALWDEIARKFGTRKVSVDEHLFTRSFVTTLQKMPGMYELVDELKAKGTIVMLLTNVSPQFAEVLRQKGHYDPFEHRVLSYEVGYWKPDPEIYQLALKKLHVKPEEAVFIDDQEKNIIAAQKLGIHGIVFKSTAQLKKELANLL